LFPDTNYRRTASRLPSLQGATTGPQHSLPRSSPRSTLMPEDGHSMVRTPRKGVRSTGAIKAKSAVTPVLMAIRRSPRSHLWSRDDYGVRSPERRPAGLKRDKSAVSEDVAAMGSRDLADPRGPEPRAWVVKQIHAAAQKDQADRDPLNRSTTWKAEGPGMMPGPFDVRGPSTCATGPNGIPGQPSPRPSGGTPCQLRRGAPHRRR
jgi:hypothetical protein